MLLVGEAIVKKGVFTATPAVSNGAGLAGCTLAMDYIPLLMAAYCKGFALGCSTLLEPMFEENDAH